MCGPLRLAPVRKRHSTERTGEVRPVLGLSRAYAQSGARTAPAPTGAPARPRYARNRDPPHGGAGGGTNGTEWNETRWRNENAGWGRTRLQGGEFDVAAISPRPACGGGRVGGCFRVSGSGGANAAIRSVRRVQRGGGARQRPVTPRGPPPAPPAEREGRKGAASREHESCIERPGTMPERAAEHEPCAWRP